MLIDQLKGMKKVIGTKQTLNAIIQGDVLKVYIALDIDNSVKNRIIEAVNKHDIEVESVDSKLELGRACGIDVGAAVAAILK
jgi:large subunit ribosomal protein L7A